MTFVVVDASALIDFLLQRARASSLGAVIDSEEISLHVPALCDVEILEVIRRALLARRLSVERAQEAILDYLDLPLTQHGHAALMGRMLQLRANFSAYDATYVALAERLDAELLTADDTLVRAVRAHTALAVRT